MFYVDANGRLTADKLDVIGGDTLRLALMKPAE